MSASNLGNDYINEENSPIPIPSAKDGWADMERRLNATPPEVHLNKRLPFLHKAALMAGIVVVSGIAFAIAYHAIIRPNTNHSLQLHPTLTDTSSARMPADENRDTLPHNYFSLEKYLPSTSDIVGAEGLHGIPPVILISDINSTGVNTKPPADEASAGIEMNATRAERQTATGNNLNTDIRNTGVNARTVARRETKGTTVHPVTPGPGSQAGGSAATHHAGTGRDISINKKKNVATKLDTNNASPKPSANNTSGDLNISGASAILFPEVNINTSSRASETSRLLLQSLPLYAGNGSALHHQLPNNIASHLNIIRKHELPEWQLFLQWQPPIPLSGSTHYLSGPNGNNQVYRLLIPGIRAVRKWNANSISLDLTPFTAQMYNDPLIRENKSTNADSSINKIKTTLRKEFGASIALLYHRRIFEQWQVATGIQFNYWMNRSTDVQTTRYPLWSSNGTDSSNRLVKESIQWQQWKIPLEVYYNAPRWQAGVRVEIPLNINRSDSIIASIKAPVQLQLMLRYKLLTRRK